VTLVVSHGSCMCLQNIKQQQTTNKNRETLSESLALSLSSWARSFPQPTHRFSIFFFHFLSILFALLNFYFPFNFEVLEQSAFCSANSLSSLIRHVRLFANASDEEEKNENDSFICVNKAKINWNLPVAVLLFSPVSCQPIINLTVSLVPLSPFFCTFADTLAYIQFEWTKCWCGCSSRYIDISPLQSDI